MSVLSHFSHTKSTTHIQKSPHSYTIDGFIHQFLSQPTTQGLFRLVKKSLNLNICKGAFKKEKLEVIKQSAEDFIEQKKADTETSIKTHKNSIEHLEEVLVKGFKVEGQDKTKDKKPSEEKVVKSNTDRINNHFKKATDIKRKRIIDLIYLPILLIGMLVFIYLET